jgi:hypothetical protein
MYGYNPKIPGDEERKSEESARRYENLLKELAKAGLLEDMPYHKIMNSFLVLRKEEK